MLKTDKSLVYYGPHPCKNCGKSIVKAGNGAPDELQFDFEGKAKEIFIKNDSKWPWPYPNNKEGKGIVWKQHACLTTKEVSEALESNSYKNTLEDIAMNIAKLSMAVTALLDGGPVKRNALIILLASSSGYSQTVVNGVLKALENLKTDYLK